jgi:hypothetical protein
MCCTSHYGSCQPPSPLAPVRSGIGHRLQTSRHHHFVTIHSPSSDYKENGGKSISRWSKFQSIKRGGFNSRVALIGSCERINLRSLREQDKGYEAHETQCRDSVLPHHHSSRTRNCHSHSSYNHIASTPIHHKYHASRYRALLL